MKPNHRPDRPFFSSGPCAKRPGWTPRALEGALTGRSHRSKEGKARLAEVIDRTRDLLGIPDDHRIGIVPASDTGAVEMALWSMLGARGVEVLAWESFGAGWAQDIRDELKVEDTRLHSAAYGELPDLTGLDFGRDVVFAWNGTTSGVRVPNGEWIADDRAGLTLCDATSAVFSVDLPWPRLDVTTWSWQKVQGGEAAHGVLVLSPRAVERLESYSPPRPLPKIFRLTKKGKLIEGVFRGETINTPSMLCVEDALDGLRWIESIGGLPACIERSAQNLAALERWVSTSDWSEFLAVDPATRSSTSICLSITSSRPNGGDSGDSGNSKSQPNTGKLIASRLEAEGVALDIGAHRDAPPGLRIWGGATVETADIEALTPWLDWAYTEAESGS